MANPSRPSPGRGPDKSGPCTDLDGFTNACREAEAFRLTGFWLLCYILKKQNSSADYFATALAIFADMLTN